MTPPDPSKDDYSAYLYFKALAAGLPWPWIGGMSADEIAIASTAHQEQTKEQMRVLAWIAYNNAALTGVAINSPNQFPRLEDAFPSLFEREKQQDWRVMKKRMEAYAAAQKC